MSTSQAEFIFGGPGEIGARCRAIDWSGTPLGPVESWPPSLCLAVRMCLDACFPMALLAGPDLRLIYNERCLSVLGPARHPWALSRPAREAWPEFWKRLGPDIERALQLGESSVREDECFVVQRGGAAPEEVHLTSSFTPIREPEGRVVGVLHLFVETTDLGRSSERCRLGGHPIPVLGSCCDIANRKLAAEAAQHGERLLRNVIDGSPDLIIFFKDWDGRFLAINSSLERVLGRSLSEIKGKTDWDIFPPDVAARYRAQDRQVLDQGQTLMVEEEVELADGLHTFLSSKFPLRDPGGRIYGVGGVSHDITQRKKTERDLHAAKLELETVDRRKSEFLAVLSHELRNPLAPIRNSLFVLERAVPGSAQAQRAQAVISRQVDQLSHLVDDLLDITRIARNKIRLQLQRLELGGLVRRTLEDHRAEIERALIILRFEPAPWPVFVNGDPNRLAQVVGNLMQNAAKFTPPGGVVSVSLTADLARGRAILRVADTGAGMAPDMLGRLFVPFMQADTTLDRSQGGLGLGLALVKGLVDQHGGSVTAHSDGLGRGSVFTVSLPLQASDVVSEEAPICHSSGFGRRVLIIEDNPDAAASLREVLELDGHEVLVAHDGRAGLAKARQCQPHVVLCDLGLPEMDGYAVARALRADTKLRQAQLIALSGYALPEDLSRASDAGFDHHLAKPANLDQLRELLIA